MRISPLKGDKSVGVALAVNAGTPVTYAYKFDDEHDTLLHRPYAPSMAMAAGWVSSGRHSVFSPVYGLGANRVVEFYIVISDAKERIVNRY